MFPAQRRNVVWVAAWVVLLQVATLLGLGVLLLHAKVMFSLGIIAYTLGLRHAMDADHIAAIDNTTRKLVGEGQRPAGIGLFFSLGHSSIVFGLTLWSALSVHLLDLNPHVAEWLGAAGTVVSAAYLYLIGGFNLRSFTRSVRALLVPGSAGASGRVHTHGGLATRLFHRLFASVRSSWQMFFIGLLFGLGFETASEVALLAMSATAAAQGVPVWYVLVFPLAFAAGMSLLDTVDGVIMVYTYEWARLTGKSRDLYNAVVTGLSVVVALFVGTVEWIQVIGQFTVSTAPVVALANRIDFEWLGIGIVAVFLVCFLALARKRTMSTRIDESL
jgi:nickel/cobalt transporter (NiCoT) family protein